MLSPKTKSHCSYIATFSPHIRTLTFVKNLLSNVYYLLYICCYIWILHACFRVLVKNENRRGNTRVSFVERVYVEYDGHKVQLWKDGKVKVSTSFNRYMCLICGKNKIILAFFIRLTCITNYIAAFEKCIIGCFVDNFRLITSLSLRQ